MHLTFRALELPFREMRPRKTVRLIRDPARSVSAEKFALADTRPRETNRHFGAFLQVEFRRQVDEDLD